ncbi:MAG: hypothetical protein IPH31_19525 [Lewinellaceae bacterium]|nr:hypothetical protein [Lewinellaceae bacterium]
MPGWPSNTFLSGELFNYQINIVVNGGTAVDLEIQDQLPANLGIDPSNIINPDMTCNGQLIRATVSVTGGTTGGCDGRYRFGALIKWKFTGTICSGMLFARQISVKSIEGEAFECEQINQASAWASNILCSATPWPNPSYTKRIFLSNSIVIKIIANSDWIVTKKSIGYVGVNVIRYKITVNRKNPYSRIGFYNLYSPIITDWAPPGGIIGSVSKPGTLCPTISYVTSNIASISLCKLDICQNWPQYFYLDVAYPCDAFPAGTSVDNCINLTGQSPPDCNTGKPPYKEQLQICAKKAIDPLGCVNNWTGTSGGGPNPTPTYTFPVTPTAYVSYPNGPQDDTCTNDILPAFYTTELSIEKGETYVANHFPGCQGQYYIRICNSGNTPVTNISVVDNWPQPCSYLTLLSTPNYPSDAFDNVSYSGCALGPSCCPSTINFNEKPGFTLYPGQCIMIYMNYEINATTPLNTVLSNCVTVNCDGTFGPPAPLCPGYPLLPFSKTVCYDFTTEPAKAKPNICKSVEGTTNYEPGQWVRYKICISNYGGAGLTGVLTDLIDPTLTNPSIIGYYYSLNAGSTCPNLPAITQSYGQLPPGLISANLSGPWNINLPAQCEVNKYATLCLLIQAQVKAYTPSGTYWNRTKLIPTGEKPLLDSTAITVAQTAVAQTWKCVKGDLDADFNDSGTATPAGMVKFRISILNSGNVPLTDFVVGDQLQAPFTTFSNGPIKAFISSGPVLDAGCQLNVGTEYSVFTTTYLNKLPIPIECLTQNGCTYGTCPPLDIWPPPPTGIVQLKFGGLILLPGQLLTVELTAIVPPTVPPGARMCNKSWVRACNAIDNTPTQVSTAYVCLTISPFVPNCCPKDMQLEIQPIANSTTITPDAVGPKMLLETSFSLLASSTVPIQEVRVTVVDKTIDYQPDAACVQCYTPYRFLGTFAQSQVKLQPTLGALLLNPYSVINKEIVYKPGHPMLFSPAQTLAVRIRLPDLQNIPCCETNGEICLKFVFKDVNCNYCERVVCIPVNYQGQ